MPRNLLPVDDPSRPICTKYIEATCPYGNRCRFFHPNMFTRSVQIDYDRPKGYCYCGARLRTLPNRKAVTPENVDEPNFYVVCDKTKRSIRNCKPC